MARQAFEKKIEGLEALRRSSDPAEIVAPLRKVIKGPNAEVITGRVAGIDHARRTATIEPHRGEPYDLDEWQRLFMFSRADTIYGGSEEIQRNLIAHHILGPVKR